MGTPGPATGPAVGDDVCGAAFAVCDAGRLELSLFAPDVWVTGVWVTEVVPGDAGAAVLVVSCFTTLGPPGEPVWPIVWRNDTDGVELPVPPRGTVVLVTGLTVVLVVAGTVVVGAAGAAGAAVVGVVATVVAVP
ncbi:MAG: hypothetical protein M3066_20740 [Actinomycetota bacterium]|nr:hypothetical protein [Actinomycetota bacterium]